MATDIDLTVRLDDPDATYDLGDAVTGTVRVSAAEAVELQGLRVRPEHRTHAGGRFSRGGPEPVELMPGGGTLAAGERRELEFRVELPFQPPPYEGKNFEVRWYVVARADVKWTRDPESEPVPLDVRVGPASREAPYESWVGVERLDVEQQETAMEWIRRFKEGSCLVKALAGCFVPMALFGAVTFLFGVLTMVTGSPQLDLLRIGGLGMLPFLALWWLSSRLSSRSAVGDVEIELEPREVRPGETLRCRVVYHPRRDLTIDGATVTLRARERYDVRGRTSTGESHSGRERSHTEWETLHEDAREVAGQQEVAKGESVEWEESFRLTEEAPYSLEADLAGLRWSILVRVAATLRRDVVREKPVIVRP